MTVYVAGSALLLWRLGPSALEWTWWGTCQVVGGVYWLLLGERQNARQSAAAQRRLRDMVTDELHLARVDSNGKLVLVDDDYRDVDDGPAPSKRELL